MPVDARERIAAGASSHGLGQHDRRIAPERGAGQRYRTVRRAMVDAGSHAARHDHHDLIVFGLAQERHHMLGAYALNGQGQVVAMRERVRVCASHFQRARQYRPMSQAPVEYSFDG